MSPFFSRLNIETWLNFPLRTRLLIGFAAFAVYAVLFSALHRFFGSSVGMLTLLPIIGVAWLMGAPAAALAWVALLPINTLLLNLSGYPGADAFYQEAGLLGIALLLLVGLVVGRIHTLALRSGDDLALRRAAEAELRAREHFIQRITSAIPDDIYVYDVNQQRYVYTNRPLAESLGYDVGESWAVGGEYWTKLMHPDDLARVPVHQARLLELEDGDVAEFEYRMRHSSGEWVWLLSRNIVFNRNADGTVQQVIGVAQDITERRFIEDLLQQEHDLLRTIIDHLPDYIFVRDTEGRFVVTNQTQALGLGMTSPDAVVGKRLAELIEPELAARYEQEDQEIMRTGQPIFDALSEEVHPEGKRWFKVTKMALRDRGDALLGVVGVVRDVTNERHAEEAKLESAMLRLSLDKERELADLKTRFINNISHELRTPLSVIQTSADMLDRYFERLEEGRRRELLRAVRDQVEQMRSQLDDTLLVMDGGRSQADIARQRIDLAAFCRELVNKFEARTHRSVDLVTSGALDGIETEPDLLRRILNNLLANAAAYSHASAPITLDVARGSDEVCLSVVDQGIGIPGSDQPRIFEAFHRGANVGAVRGAGVGLWIARDHARRLGGKLTFSSEEDRGSTFTLTLPL